MRRITGSEGLETTLLKAVKVLASHGIAHLVGGGFALQERGYHRYTLDLDVIVPDDVAAATRLAYCGFALVAPDRAVDHDTGIRVRIGVQQPVEVHLLPGGVNIGRGPLPLPVPTQVSEEPQVLSLESILSGKLSAGMMKDLADAVELIKRNVLPRAFPLRAEVEASYQRASDIAQAEAGQAEMIRKSQRLMYESAEAAERGEANGPPEDEA